MLSLVDYAREYLLREVEPAVSGKKGHDRTFHAACCVIKGWYLSIDEGMLAIQAWNDRCSPPWSEKDLRYKLKQAHAKHDKYERGYLGRKVVTDAAKQMRDTVKALQEEQANDIEIEHTREVFFELRKALERCLPQERFRRKAAMMAEMEHVDEPRPAKSAYEPEKLRKLAGGMVGKVDLLWLADRSKVDPCTVTPDAFLGAIFDRNREKAIVATVYKSQGQAVWPLESVPLKGPDGVWYLNQPVDGRYYPNPRQGGKASRRSEESVTSWRYMVWESDEAPVDLWLAALVQLPVRIVAIYSSGGKSVHALVRVDARTKREWDKAREAYLPLSLYGLDTQTVTAVRLTRLPNCRRGGKLQQLMYLNPEASAVKLADVFPKRNTLEPWLRLAEAGVGDGDDGSTARRLRWALEFYGSCSVAAREALERFNCMEE